MSASSLFAISLLPDHIQSYTSSLNRPLYNSSLILRCFQDTYFFCADVFFLNISLQIWLGISKHHILFMFLLTFMNVLSFYQAKISGRLSCTAHRGNELLLDAEEPCGCWMPWYSLQGLGGQWRSRSFGSKLGCCCRSWSMETYLFRVLTC